MDIFDRAQEADAQMTEQALAAHRQHAAAKGPARTHCIDCEQPIPNKRRETVAGCERCISCQEKFEDMERWR